MHPGLSIDPMIFMNLIFTDEEGGVIYVYRLFFFIPQNLQLHRTDSRRIDNRRTDIHRIICPNKDSPFMDSFF